MTKYDFIEARKAILSNILTDSNLTFGQLFVWIWANNDRIYIWPGLVILINVQTDTNLT